MYQVEMNDKVEQRHTAIDQQCTGHPVVALLSRGEDEKEAAKREEGKEKRRRILVDVEKGKQGKQRGFLRRPGAGVAVPVSKTQDRKQSQRAEPEPEE